MLSCGGAAKPTITPVVIPEQASPPHAAALDGGAARATDATPHAMPPGSDGPGDAVGMIGEAGSIFPADATTVVLVNTAAMRAHPLGTRAMHLLNIVLVGWDLFMPVDLVPPVRDLEWVLLGGTLVLGSTRSAVFLSRYNVSEAQADAVSAELTKRLSGKTTKLGVPSASSFAAIVDGVDRAYVRPQPGVLAIVPSADGKRVAELLVKADIPGAVRPRELARMSWPRAARAPLPIPRSVKSLRIWINGSTNDELTVAAEGECSDRATALEAVDDLRARLRDRATGFARTMLRSFIDDAAIWADGATVRYEAKLPAALLDAFTAFACMRTTGKPDCPP